MLKALVKGGSSERERELNRFFKESADVEKLKKTL